MFTKDQHIARASENESFARGLDITMEIAANWAITVFFYAAVHHVEGYFAFKGLAYVSHRTRDSAIHRDPLLREIYDDYRELETLSREARYDCSTFTFEDTRYAEARLGRIKLTLSSIP